MTDPEVSSETLAHGVLARDRSMLAHAITLAESASASHQTLVQDAVQRLLSRTGKAIRISVNGTHCANRNAFIESLGLRLIELGHRVAVLAIDPGRQHPRGSTPSQQTHMRDLSPQDEAFVHRSARDGCSAGVTRVTRTSLLLCEAAGFDVVLVETADDDPTHSLVSEMVDCCLVLVSSVVDDQSPNMRESPLTMADIIAVIKADGSSEPPASQLTATYQQALADLSPHGSWIPVAVACSVRIDVELDQLWQYVRQHRRQMIDTGEFIERREQQTLRWS
ncbi:hypothetical protein ACUNV4_11380 [Granulosicoccus sp. 3-233]|uniref:hypothetical protein n=1 Tax=Granulosicoccus sp. 3-233 TaxID=3417969 RepID=UPI003D354991